MTIFDSRAYHLHTLYFVDFIPEETPRLENQFILMPPSSGIPSFQVPFPSAPQFVQPRFRDLLPVAIAGTVTLGLRALLEKAFKGSNQAQPMNGPSPLIPPVSFPGPQYYGASYSMNINFTAQNSLLPISHLAPNHTRASSLSRLDERIIDK